MGERYFITGVQLGMLKALTDNKTSKKEIDLIIENQFIGNFKTDMDKVRFIKYIKRIKNVEDILNEDE